MCCCWYHKGTNFQANHNLTPAVIYGNMVVADTTKVRIFKQITTIRDVFPAFDALLLIPQRYEFSSKSQRRLTRFVNKNCCCWYHKGTNFQANHNAFDALVSGQYVVADTTKVRIFKQITTSNDVEYSGITLLLIPQRYEFSSKSQHFYEQPDTGLSCCWYHKGTNFQANHNTPELDALGYELLLIPQRYEFSSKSQRQSNYIGSFVSCCWYHKGTNFQANHNGFHLDRLITELLLIPQRYEFSSKSQQVMSNIDNIDVVADTTKVRIFKQITTNYSKCLILCVLLLIPQRYEFSSKSQHTYF